MGLLEQTKQIAIDTATQVGRAGLHALLPDDFEYYACTLELRDSAQGLEQVINFPVMPSSINVSRVSQVNIKKTVSGISSLINTSFTPSTISIQGTFGRKLKLLIMPDSTSFTNNDKIGFNGVGVDFAVKSGYGMIKLMEKMVIASQQLDKYGKPRLLYFYNMALGQSFLIEALNFMETQSQDSNMIWNYTLEMKSIAPADAIIDNPEESKKKLVTALSVTVINKTINNIITRIRG